MRASISLVVIGLAFAGSLGSASAQYYPAPPYAGQAPVYRDANGAPIDPRYVRPAAGEAPYADPPLDQPYFAPQPMPAVDGAAMQRPPGSIASGPAPADVTGSIRSPATPSANAAPLPANATVVAGLPPEDQPEQGPSRDLPPQFRRQIVSYNTIEPAGTIVIDTPNT